MKLFKKGKEESNKESIYIKDIYSAPVFHWLMFQNKHDVRFIEKLDPIQSEAEVEELLQAYYNINDQVLSEFGINESYEAQIELKEQVALLKLEFIISEDRARRTEYKIKQLEINSSEQAAVEMSVSAEVALVCKNANIPPINIKTTTIHQYLMMKQ